MSEKERKQKVSPLHSMKTQFLIVVLIVTAIIVTLYTVLIMPRVKDNIRNIYGSSWVIVGEKHPHPQRLC